MAVSKRIRTDLALETTERFAEENAEIRGVEVHEEYDEEKDVRTTVVKIVTERLRLNGAKNALLRLRPETPPRRGAAQPPRRPCFFPSARVFSSCPLLFRFVHRAVRSTVRSAMPLPRSFFAIDTAKYRISSIA